MTQIDPNASLDKRRSQRRENRRRGADAARQIDTSVKSPCISVCHVENGLCVGCRRNLDEIRDWMIMTAEEKLAVIDKYDERGALV